MPDTDLNINSNIQELLAGLDRAVKATENLTKDTKEYQQSSNTAFTSAEKSIEDVNKAIKEQAVIIKDLEKRNREYERTAKRLGANQSKDWKRLKADLRVANDEMSALKRKQEELQPVTTKLSGLYSKLGGILGGVFSAAAIIKFSKEVIFSTDSTSDAWDRFVTGVREGMGFLNRAMATADFSNLIQEFEKAIKAGIEYAKVQDLITNRQRSAEIRKLEIEGEITRLKGLARLKATDLAQREDYIKQIESLETEKLTITKDLAQQDLDSKLDLAQQRSGLDKKEIEDFVRNFSRYEAQIEKGQKLKSMLDGLKASADEPIISPEGVVLIREGAVSLDQYNKAVASLTEEEKEAIRIYEGTNKLTDDQKGIRDELAVSIRNLQKAENDYTQGVASMSRIRNEIESVTVAEREKAHKAFLEQLNEQHRMFGIITNDLGEITTYDELFREGREKSAAAMEKEAEAANKLHQAFKELFDEFRDEENVDDIPKAVEKLGEQLIKEAENVKKWKDDNPFWAALGLEDDDQVNAIKDYASQALEFINKIIDAQVEASERLVDDLDQRISEQEELVNREADDRREGLANNYEIEKENLQKMQQARDQAIKDREKQIRIQRTLATIESGVALISAAANIMKGFSTIPIVGVILGIAAVGAMIAAFAISSSKVKEATQFGEGGRLKGRRHSQGGLRIEGTNQEVEGGEWVVNRGSSEKYNDLLNAINSDDRKALQIAVNRHNLIKAFPINTGYNIDDSKKLGEIVSLMKKGDTIVGNGFLIEQRGTTRRKINLS